VSAPISVAPLPEDFARWSELLAMIRASFAYMDGVIDPPSSVHRLTPDLLAEKAAAETGFVALAADEIAGSAFLAEQSDCLYLGKLAVAPAWQGKGVGARLMRAAEEHARNVGKPVIELQTRIELTGNQHLFAKLGFAETGRTAHAGFARPTSVTMRKAVA
jgi:GNAT superfamily N-acetyltransferase